MSRIRTFLFIAIFGFAVGIGQVVAQPPSLSDTLSYLLQIPPVMTGNFDTRHTFISGQPATTWGVRGGLQHGKRFQYGVGFHWMEHGFVKEFSELMNLAELRLAYVAPYVEYSFIHREKWEVAVPLRFGVGRSLLLVANEDGILAKEEKGLILLYEPAMSVKYRFLKFFGTGVAVGYRLMLLNNKGINQPLNAPTWGLLFSVDVGSMFDALSE